MTAFHLFPQLLYKITRKIREKSEMSFYCKLWLRYLSALAPEMQDYHEGHLWKDEQMTWRPFVLLALQTGGGNATDVYGGLCAQQGAGRADGPGLRAPRLLSA